MEGCHWDAHVGVIFSMVCYEEGPVPDGLQTMRVKGGGKQMQIHELLQVSTPST